jgi:cytochrome c biogenesis protein CcdA
MIDKDDLVKVTKIRPSLSKLSILVSLGIFTTIAIVLSKNSEWFQPIENFISQTENQYEKWGENQPLTNPWLLIPFTAGLTFALISSPCASPVLFAVLAAAAATGSPVWSVLTMVAYALGYTVVIFATSLFAGLMKFTRQILMNSDAVMRWGGLALILMGGYYVVSGVLWLL